jgi:hypothetical protein
MNKLDFHLVDDPREKALRDAVYDAIARVTPLSEEHHEHDEPEMALSTSAASVVGFTAVSQPPQSARARVQGVSPNRGSV